MTFRDKVLELLRIQGITQTELSERMGKSRSNLSMLLKPDRKVAISTIREFAKALNVDPAFLLSKESQESFTAARDFGRRFAAFVNEKDILPDTFAEETKIAPSTFWQLFRGDIIPSHEIIEIISEVYPDLNMLWLLTGNGLMFKTDTLNEPESAISEYQSDHIELIRKENLTEFRRLGEDRYLVLTPLIRSEAFEVYIDNHNDPDFLEELPLHALSVDNLNFGVYRSFEAPVEHHGGSNEDFIGEGWIVTGKKIEKSTWKRGISFRKYPTYIVVVKQGILMLHVTDYDRDEQAIRFSGPETEHYPNDLIPLDDILELYSVVAVTDPRK